MCACLRARAHLLLENGSQSSEELLLISWRGGGVSVFPFNYRGPD